MTDGLLTGFQICCQFCWRRDSNPHGACAPPDFKSDASADSATPAPDDWPAHLPELEAATVGYGTDGQEKRPGRDHDPDGIRTRVAALKGPCPRPLDDGATALA